MQILEKILLATDFTKSNENAIESSIVMAKTFGSKIILLHVLPKDLGSEKAKLLLDRAAKSELNKLRERMNSEGVETDEPILEYGDHLDRIIYTSERIDANMILIGAGEKSKKEAVKLGTTALKIIQKSDKPVMVIQSGKYLDIKKIICPVDFSDESKRALDNAMIMARRFNAELIVLNVFDEAYDGPLTDLVEWVDHSSDLLERQKERFNLFLADFNLKDINWKKKIKRGDFAKIILKMIAKENVDLMVIGTSGRKGLSKFFIGSVTEKVIREVPCSFVTLKSENFIELKLSAQISDIEHHFNNAKQLVKDGMYKAAINEFRTCIKINELHVPSLKGIAMVYEILDDKENAEKYNQLARDVMSRIWDSKIEAEVRRFYNR